MSQPIDELAARRRNPCGITQPESVRILGEATDAMRRMASNLDPAKPNAAALDDIARQADAVRVAALRAAAAARANTPGAA